VHTPYNIIIGSIPQGDRPEHDANIFIAGEKYTNAGAMTGQQISDTGYRLNIGHIIHGDLVEGFVGIGTNDPQLRLQVEEDSVTAIQGRSTSDFDTVAGIRAIGKCPSSAGILKAAALEIQEGPMRVSGTTSCRVAGTITMQFDSAVASCNYN